MSVRDNGPGLTAEQRQHIFEPFFTTKTKGTGLGMAIAQRIVEAHGGQIAVGDAPSRRRNLLSFSKRNPMSQSFRIAVADDEPDMRDYFQEFCRAWAIRSSRPPPDGSELLEKCRTTSPDLVITDIKMPDMDGIDAAFRFTRAADPSHPGFRLP